MIRKSTRWHLRQGLLIPTVGVMTGLSFSSPSLAQERREITSSSPGGNWSIVFGESWIGGGFYDMQRVIEGTPAGRVRSVFQFVQARAKGIDAYFVEYGDFFVLADRAAEGKAQITEIRVLYNEFSSEMLEMVFGTEEFASGYWESAAETETDYPDDDSITAVRVVSTRWYAIDGRIATEALLENTHTDGRHTYKVSVIVVHEDWTHNFDLRVDAAFLEQRRDDFRRMMASLSYNMRPKSMGH